MSSKTRVTAIHAAGEPVEITPQPQLLPGRRIAPQVRADDGYIYPADGSSDRPALSRRRAGALYDAQAYPQQQNQYYNNPGIRRSTRRRRATTSSGNITSRADGSTGGLTRRDGT